MFIVTPPMKSDSVQKLAKWNDWLDAESQDFFEPVPAKLFARG